jgi:hypothetical protein
MATYEITGIRTEETEDDPHEHITRVRLGGTKTGDGIGRAMVVDDLRKPGGDRYYTEGGGKKADVVVVNCPDCAFKDYITTTPDSTKANNLLSLERF